MNLKRLLMMVGMMCLSVASYAAFDPSTAAPAELRAKAEQGDATAQFSLGLKFLNGEGVSENHKEALKWFRLSAEQGVAEAQYNAGILYRYGGIPELDCEDYVEAFAWFSLPVLSDEIERSSGSDAWRNSSSVLSVDAQSNLSALLERMTPEQVSEGKKLAELYATKQLRELLEKSGDIKLPFDEALKAFVDKRIGEIHTSLEAIYAPLEKKRAEELATRQREMAEYRKGQIINRCILGGAICAVAVFVYGMYWVVRQNKPLRLWQKILSGWIVWGVLVGLYALLFEKDILLGQALFPPLAATIVFSWWSWLKHK
jgi:hypothetical protein